ncbi:malate synthase G [Novosphingobium malaysiense]|uniref:Malate synthase G n=1 Tax=Novosphingobium malaysiense TaxID=1348853 RepID=A0A0B1ZFG9_9SPHN|nr:malate synthase G [Novosphingobium malaysiense]KHK89821.1 malate synthase [Novosphingobium malaysiense]
MVERSGLQVFDQLAEFVEQKALPGTGLDPETFWNGLAEILEKFVPENQALLAKRDELQRQLDEWHTAHPGPVTDMAAYRDFLAEIGYLLPEPAPFSISTANVDPEIATMAGPQLVVPALNERFVLNAANARWGSLYDAFYGTDALDAPAARPGGYDKARGAAVIARVRAFLDATIPGWERAISGDEHPALAGRKDGGVLFRHNGLHIEIVIDPQSPVGRTDPLGIADVILESALTTIVDLEDSVAVVDGEDLVHGYSNWLGLMRGELTATFEKAGQTRERKLAEDRHWTAPDGTGFTLPGRSVLFVRNVGHLMTTPAVRLPDDKEAPLGLLDAVLTSLCAVHDLKQLGRLRNSRAGSIYIVKPKQHGPEEVAFSNRLFDAVEDLLSLERNTIKMGLMDEERRTSANLAACIAAARGRVVFINTGFLDRTGDEMHTAMQAGPMIRKAAMKGSDWLQAYEDRNVRIGLACGLSGKAQIGKGMWAAPDMMAAMLEQKIAHPRSGANTAWVPSPTAATLHAMHYHDVDVFEIQKRLADEAAPDLSRLLTIPVAEPGRNWSDEEVREELENNCQGILGYVVRWIDQGIGCSKVPDIHDVGQMEDRATLRISSQHIANWLHHGVCTREQVEDAFARMAAKVDAQNAGDPSYRKLSPDGPAWQAAHALIFEGISQPSGYTEPLLHAFRLKVKAQA